MASGQGPWVPARRSVRARSWATWVVLAGLFVLALAGCQAPAAPAPETGLPADAPAPIEADIVSASAIVVPFREAALSIRASGRLQEEHNPPNIADGTRTTSLGKITFPLVL